MRTKPLILLVDDEKDFLEIISMKLSASGFDPVVAHNAKEAIDAAKKLLPDLILMDVHMPGETGTDAALDINQNPETKNIKIAFLSNVKDPWPSIKDEPDALVKAMGMEAFIDKSTDLDEIVVRIRKMLAV